MAEGPNVGMYWRYPGKLELRMTRMEQKLQVSPR